MNRGVTVRLWGTGSLSALGALPQAEQCEEAEVLTPFLAPLGPGKTVRGARDPSRGAYYSGRRKGPSLPPLVSHLL